VRGGGDDIRVRKGRGNGVSSDQSADVRHIGDEICPDLIGDFLHALIVDEAAVGGCSRYDYFRTVERGSRFQSVVVNYPSLFVDAIRHGFEVRADGGDFFRIGLVACALTLSDGGAKIPCDK
jgi:hypothetical protein